MAIDDAESPAYIPRSSANRIDGRLRLAGQTLGRVLRQDGVYDTYFVGWNSLPVPLRHEVRQLVNSYNDPRPPREDAEGNPLSKGPHLHPFSQAAERGLIIGSLFAREVIGNESMFERFAKRMAAQFKTLRMHLGSSPYDLSDALRHTGAPFANMLEETIDPDLTDFDPADETPIEMQRQAIYAHAVGYVGAAAVTRLAELELRRFLPVDDEVRADMGEDLNFLTDQAAVLYPSDFPPPITG